MHHFVTALLLAVAFASLTGCGQTGPLYMPPEEAPQTQPNPSGEPATPPSPGA